MRRTNFLLLCFSLCWLTAQAHDFVTQSVLRSGNIVKLQVNATGIYCLTYEQIQAMGISNPAQVRLLGYGGNILSRDLTKAHIDDVPSIPFYMYKGDDHVFSPGDYILFYANGPVGWDVSGKNFVRTRNCYADYGCYFISDDAGEQKIIALGEEISATSCYPVYNYTALQLHETDQINLVDMDNGREGGGKEWYGEKFVNQTRLTVPFQFDDVDLNTKIRCKIDLAAAASIATKMGITLAGKTDSAQIGKLPTSNDSHVKAVGKSTILTPQPQSNDLSVTLAYRGDANSVAYLNYIEMQVTCQMRLRGNHLVIRNTEHLNTPIPSKYHLLGADQFTQIWDVTAPAQAYIVPTTWQNDTLCWISDNTSAHVFLAVRTNSRDWNTPASRGRITNQNLHADLRGKQHVIITPDEFRPAAERLKQIHEQYSTEKWQVVSEEEVFNEFSSGTPDASAYRWMMKYLYEEFKNTNQAPKTLLLFGDGTFDNRKLLKTSGPRYLLTYQADNSLAEADAYATDDFFGWLDDANSAKDVSAQMKIGVGRLPIRSYEEATTMVQKINSYIQDRGAGAWKQQLCFLADDGDHNLHTECADAAAIRVSEKDSNWVVNKIYLDSYVQETTASGESYPLAYNTFSNLLQSGVMLMDYAGHGSANNICSEMFLTRNQVENMTNANQGIWALATCSFAHFDQYAQSTAEIAVLNPLGGAIGVVSADRTVYASQNTIINREFCDKLFYHTDPFTYPYTIGEALMAAKNSTSSSSNDHNKLAYVLLGDPALRLNYPCQYTAKISEIPSSMRALDLVTIKGYISNGDTTLARRDTATFNGELTITIFDKQQSITTRDNDEPIESSKKRYTFQDYPNKIFSGTVAVQDTFTVVFRMPKDIRYNVDKGRITLYALGKNAKGTAEAMGHYENFQIGGSSPWSVTDNQGPDMHLYLNSTFFSEGDIVNPTPHFYADLYDDNGINTVGSGIGHDLMLVLDNQAKQTYILNNYYKADYNSYQSGTVSYMLPELSNGSHMLTFRAWDPLNNSTTQSLRFTVDSALLPQVQSVIVYPNPVSQFGTMNMYVLNDRPDDLINVEITFFSPSGQKVWSGTRALDNNSVAFSMTDATLYPGIYIYQFTIQTSTQSSQKHSGKLIVY